MEHCQTLRASVASARCPAGSDRRGSIADCCLPIADRRLPILAGMAITLAIREGVAVEEMGILGLRGMRECVSLESPAELVSL